jgi:hypothetical protein
MEVILTVRIIYPAAPEQALSNSRNLFVIGGSASDEAARTYAEVMANVPPGTFDGWTVTSMVDSAAYSFVGGIHGPVGRAGSPWALLTAGGDPLPVAA